MGFNATTSVMCQPVNVENRNIHHYSCAIGSCKYCSSWESSIPELEKNCTDTINYYVFLLPLLHCQNT